MDENETWPGGINIFIVCIYYQHLYGIKAQSLISELSTLRNVERGRQRRGHLVKSCTTNAALFQISSVKGASSLWICNYLIKYYIGPAAHSCQVQRKFGIMA